MRICGFSSGLRREREEKRERFEVSLGGRRIRVRAAEAFNSDGKIMGQEILEKECISGDTQYVALRSVVTFLPRLEKSTVPKVRKLFRTLQKFK